MCYRISFKTKLNKLSDLIPDLEENDQIEIDYEKSDHVQAMDNPEYPIVYHHPKKGTTNIDLMSWGVIPKGVKLERDFVAKRLGMANARSERVLDDKDSYWYAIKNNRILIPVNGIYEYRHVEGFKNKIPYHIWLKSQETFFLPGLYSVTHLEKNLHGAPETKVTWTMFTRPANYVMRQIHNSGAHPFRMPNFLTKELAQMYLNPDLTEDDYRAIINYEIPNQEIQFHPVFQLSGKAQRPDGKKKSEAWHYDNLPPVYFE